MTNFDKLKSVIEKPQYSILIDLFGSDVNYQDCLWGIELWYDEFLMSKDFQEMDRETKMKTFQTYRHLNFILKVLDAFEEDNEINEYNPD